MLMFLERVSTRLWNTSESKEGRLTLTSNIICTYRMSWKAVQDRIWLQATIYKLSATRLHIMTKNQIFSCLP